MAKKNTSENITITNFTIDDFPSESEVVKEDRRIDWFHISTHLLAFFIIGTFLFMNIHNIFVDKASIYFIPDYLISIVSVVIGFYFAKSPFFGSRN